MHYILFVAPFFILRNCVNCDIDVTGRLFKELPPIFHIDDDKPCRNQGKLHCKISINLQPSDLLNKSAHWKVVEDTINHPKFYNHNKLLHAICVNDFCPGEIMKDGKLDLISKLSECYEMKYANLGLKFVITDHTYPTSEYRYSPGIIDVLALSLAVVYIMLIVIATFEDYKRNSRNQENNRRYKLALKIVTAFSVLTNWKKLCSLNDRSDFQKLKFIQGIRFYNMLLIIFCHTVSSYIGGYISNTEYFELVYRNQMRLSVSTLFVFLVQTFFLISAFLLSYHVCQNMETYKGSKWRYVLVTFLNRYLRILPPLIVAITLSSTVWIARMFHGPVKEFFSDKEYERCRENWWTNLLFINNHYNEAEMCYFITWYLAADTQLYLVSLILLLSIWTFRRNTKFILAFAVSVGIVIPTIICYKYSLDIVFRITPENTRNDHFRSFEFNAIYTSTFTNMASYMVGLGLGMFYFALERRNVYTKYHHLVCMGLFSFLPTATVLISSQDYSRNVNLLLSGLIKPSFAIGIGAGILAMSRQKNGIIKKICELKPVLFLGNFAYSTYVVQYGIVFYRTAVATEPLVVSDYILIKSFIKDAVLSILAGFCMHILVEMPAIQLQKMYIPQIRPTRTKSGTKPKDLEK